MSDLHTRYLCLSCRTRPRKWRGLCQGCYERARRRVLAGETTWQRLADQGACRPAVRRLGQAQLFWDGVNPAGRRGP